MRLDNLFSNIPPSLPEELIEKIIETGSFKLERIVSKGHATPEGEWYDQDRDEWVVLLKGSAALLIEGQAAAALLKPGDHIRLPAHLRHRVEWTDPETETLWLALHYESEP